MEYHKIFKYFENKTIIKTGEFYKKALVSGLNKERAFNHIGNNFTKIISEKEESTIPKSDQELHELLRIFKNRAQYYGSNDTENIFKYELLKKYNRSKISDVITYKEVVIRTAIYEGLTKSYAIISNHSNYFSMLYKFDELKKFVFTYDANRLNELEREIRRKYYPENSENIIEMTKVVIDDNPEDSSEITLHGIKFNLQEFALYQKEWSDCYSEDIGLRDIYDKVFMDFNDPYNYGNKRYDSTPFYKILKEDYLKYKQNFDVCLAYEKVEKLVDKTSNKLFKAHIKKKLEKAKFKLK